jgi:uncharacterized protein (DUF433 family)
MVLDEAMGDLQRNSRSEVESMANVSLEHITKTSGVCGGKACIAGHRIRVMDIVVWHEFRGYSADEIVAMFPGVTLADVHAALAYYFDNRAEIEAEFRSEEALVEQLKTRHPSKVREKLGE